MKEVKSDPGLVAYCGLYCGACAKYLKEKCAGCHDNVKATWCKVKACCEQNNYATCADCKDHTDPNDCSKFDNFMSKLFGMIFKSDPAGSIAKIREAGLQGYADEMTAARQISVKKTKSCGQ